MPDIDNLAEIIVNAFELQGKKIDRLAEVIANTEPPVVNVAPAEVNIPETEIDLSKIEGLLKELIEKDNEIKVKLDLV